MLSPSKRRTSSKFYNKTFVLAIGGGVVFWVTTVATSLLFKGLYGEPALDLTRI